MSRSRIDSVQVLRAIAASLVLIAHCADRSRENGWELYDGWIGGIGVDIFFIVSGFIMAFVTAHLKGGGIDAFDFVRRRIVRIAPIYWLVTLAVLLSWLFAGVEAFSGLHLDHGWKRVLGSFLFLEPRPLVLVGWTLVYEMMFYAVVAASLFLPITHMQRMVCVGILFVAFVAINFALKPAVPNAVAFVGRPMVLEFSIGTAIFLAFHNGARIPRWLSCCLILTAILGAASILSNHVTNHGHPAWIAISTALVVGLVSLEHSIKWRRFPIVLLLGDASYSLYLIHIYIVLVIEIVFFRFIGIESAAGAIAFVVTGAAAAIGCSIAIYSHLECHITRRFSMR